MLALVPIVLAAVEAEDEESWFLASPSRSDKISDNTLSLSRNK